MNRKSKTINSGGITNFYLGQEGGSEVWPRKID